jgi:hypothetical protein
VRIRRFVTICTFVLFASLSSTRRVQSQSLFFMPPAFHVSYPGSGQCVSADFNNDGKPDLICADGTVLLGNGDGTFATGTPLTLPLPGPASEIVTGDLNADGNADLVLTFTGSTNLYVFFGNGKGTFGTAIASNVGTTLTSLVAADVNGDGKTDILGINGHVFVFLSKGDGTFTAKGPYALLSATANLLTVGDFNGDGKLDIALAAAGTGVPGLVGILLGNGDGTFQPAITSTGVTTPAGLVSSDFNGDGKLDLAVSDFASGETFIFVGNGDGSFQAPISPLPLAGTLAVAEVNGDAKPDLIIAGTPFLQIFLGNGDGTFTNEDSYYESECLVCAQSLVVADFNGDQKPDLAVDNSILIGNGDGSFQGILGISLTESPLYTGVAGDFNGDGIPDVAVESTNASPNIANNLYILLGDGTGKLSLAHTYSLPQSASAIVTADLNGDGKLDLVTFELGQPPTLSVLLGKGDGSFGSPLTAPLGSLTEAPIQFAISDLNGDRKADLVVLDQPSGSIMVFLGNGDGTFASPTSYFVGSTPTSFAIADFNNDGHPDVAVSIPANLSILLGKGDGTFQPATFAASPLSSILTTGDLNKDGNADLVGVSSLANPAVLQVLLGKGDGTFQSLAPSTLYASSAASLADINADGDLDLVQLINGSGPTVPGVGLQVLLGNGDGTFSNSFLLPTPADQSAPPPLVVVASFTTGHAPDVVFAPPEPVGQGVTWGLATLSNLTATPFQISASALAPVAVVPGSNATSNVTLTTTGGFSRVVTFSCTGLPVGANCSFAPASVSGSGASVLTLSISASTPLGIYPVSITASSNTLMSTAVLALTVATSAGPTASVDPGSLTFAPQPAGTTSSPQTVTVTNTGGASLTISSVVITGTNVGDFTQTNTCKPSPSLASGAACQISVTFTPGGIGPRSATLSVTDNGTGSPQTVPLNGTGPDFSVSASPSTATVSPGQTATYTISLAPSAGFSQMVGLTCSGAPALAACAVMPSSVQLNGTGTTAATVNITTTAPGGGWVYRSPGPRKRLGQPTPLPLALLVLTLIAFLWSWRQCTPFAWTRLLSVTVILWAGATIISCGGGTSGGGSPGTPAGTYTITVVASPSGATGITHNTKLTLVVQ